MRALALLCVVCLSASSCGSLIESTFTRHSRLSESQEEVRERIDWLEQMLDRLAETALVNISIGSQQPLQVDAGLPQMMGLEPMPLALPPIRMRLPPRLGRR